MKISSAPVVVVLCADEDVRNSLRHWCAESGIRAFTTTDGYEANIVLKNYPIKLLVVDRILPAWPGLDTLAQLRSDNASLRVAFVDDGARNSAAFARVSGAHMIFTKPMTHQQLLAALENVQ